MLEQHDLEALEALYESHMQAEQVKAKTPARRVRRAVIVVVVLIVGTYARHVLAFVGGDISDMLELSCSWAIDELFERVTKR